jgi:putative ABC transport system permease protein
MWKMVSRRRRYEELAAEVRMHLEERVEELVARGMAREEAGFVARREFGNLGVVVEDGRAVWRWAGVEDFARDVRFGLRMLGKTPGFAAIAVVILALGIGANAAVFSLIDALLLRSLAVPAAHDLVEISFGPTGDAGPLSGPMFDRLRERQGAFTDIFAWTNRPMVLTENGVARPIQAAYATGSAFPTLQLRARVGRLLDWSDDDAARGAGGFAAVISENFWLEHFGGANDVVGRTIVVNGMTATIVGVMPRAFNGITVDYAPQVVLPFAFDVASSGAASSRFDEAARWLFAMGRLKAGVGYGQAQANVATVADEVLRESLPKDFQRVDYLREGRLVLSPGRAGKSPLGEMYGRSLWTLQALVGLLLVICCANLASLQVSRSLQRQHEFVVRSALGAKRLRLVRQMVIESVMVAAAGAAAGLALSQWMSALLVRYIEQSDFPVFLNLRPNALVFGWTAGLTAVVVVLAGVLPAIQISRVDAEAMLRAGTQRRVAAGRRNGLAARLLPMQVALSVLLVSVALLFAASAWKLLRVDPGFRIQGVTLFGVDFERQPETGAARIGLYRKMLEELRNAPGIEAASVIAVRPLDEGGIDESAAPVEGNGPEEKHLFENVVGPEYFSTAGTKVLKGREFSEFDRAGANAVCIVNQAAAGLFFPGRDALGMHVRSTEIGATRAACEIVGVVVDAKYNSVRQSVPPTIYHPYEQASTDIGLGFITRSRDTASAAAAFGTALRRVAPDTPVMPFVTMRRQLEASVGQERLLASVSLFLGGLALALTCIGLYGSEMQRVTQRRAEIGLRMALGAQRRDVARFVLREAGMVLAVGVPIGLSLALAASRFVRGFLYELSPLDLRVHAATVLAMVIVGAIAAYLPARRAMAVEPMVALRHE